MRRHFLFAAGLLFATFVMTTAGRADGGPICATTYNNGGSVVDCDYKNFEQCRATISGRGGSCDPNPFYSYRDDLNRVPGRRVRRY